MRTSLPLLSLALTLTLLSPGCAGPEQKLGRGIDNLFEIVRGGERRRSIEQTAITDGPDVAYTAGLVRGMNRSFARTMLGVYEIVTFPIPSYDPIFTHYLAPNPVYPDSYKPSLIEDSTFATDTSLGFSGGDVAPMIPGSRFRIYDN